MGSLLKKFLSAPLTKIPIWGTILNYSILVSVNGHSLKLISGFPLSETNFKNSWDTLCTRYDKKRDLTMA